MRGWRVRRGCVDTDPGLFFDARTRDDAIAICDVCPVRAECLAWTLEVEGTTPGRSHGVAGGLAATNRDDLRRTRQRKSA